MKIRRIRPVRFAITAFGSCATVLTIVTIVQTTLAKSGQQTFPDPFARTEREEGQSILSATVAPLRARTRDAGYRNALRSRGIRRVAQIEIPALGIRSPVLEPSRTLWNARAWSALEQDMQIAMRHGAVAYPQERPVILGHSSPPGGADIGRNGTLFARLPELREGDRIILTMNGTPTTFTIRDFSVVQPRETGVLLGKSGEEILTLITCFPVGTTRERLVVRATREQDLRQADMRRDSMVP